MRASPLVTAAFLLAACQEPFGTDRHDLVGFRVAGVRVQAEGDDLRAGAAVIVQGRPWSDAPIHLAWHLVDDLSTDHIVSLDPADAVADGPTPLLTDWADRGGVALVATHGDSRYYAVIDLSGAVGPSPALTRIDTLANPLRIDSFEADDLSLEARRTAADGDPVDAISPGDFVRLRANVDEAVRIRWMITAPGGTFLELDRRTTDWAAGAFVVDDDEVEERTIGVAGPRTLLALALDPELGGANRWVAHDLWVGEPPVGIRTPSGRWLRTDTAVAGPFVRGTLAAADGDPTGLRLTGAESVDVDTDPGTDGLACAVPVSGRFDPTWLLEQRCARADVLGATVVVGAR
jgi:hypothetical protein